MGFCYNAHEMNLTHACISLLHVVRTWRANQIVHFRAASGAFKGAVGMSFWRS